MIPVTLPGLARVVNTNASPAGLSQDTEYFWQARALSTGGTTEANSGSWWSLRTEVQIHDCSIDQAEDFTNEAEVELEWSQPHHRCVLISPGTKVTWIGNLVTHPLKGGVSPIIDVLSPINSEVDQNGSVVLNDEGDYPYFCEIHLNDAGVIYILGSPNERIFEDGFETN